jgi:hypothetical protein
VFTVKLRTPCCGDGRSQWSRCLRRRSAAAHLLRLWVRIPQGAWMPVCCDCYVLSGRGLCDELITRPEESYWLWRVVVCDQETSWMRRPCPTGGCRAKNKQRSWGDGIVSHFQTKSQTLRWSHQQTHKLIYPKYIAELLELQFLYCGWLWHFYYANTTEVINYYILDKNLKYVNNHQHWTMIL